MIIDSGNKYINMLLKGYIHTQIETKQQNSLLDFKYGKSIDRELIEEYKNKNGEIYNHEYLYSKIMSCADWLVGMIILVLLLSIYLCWFIIYNII